jgi:hypothetical protein
MVVRGGAPSSLGITTIIYILLRYIPRYSYYHYTILSILPLYYTILYYYTYTHIYTYRDQ